MAKKTTRGKSALRAVPSPSADQVAKDQATKDMVAALNAKVQTGSPLPLSPVNAPIYFANTVQIQNVGTGFNVIFMRARPVSQGDQPVSTTVAMQEVVAIIEMSAHSLKDFSIIMPEVVAQFEKEFGTMNTPLLKKRAADKPASLKKH